MVNAATKFECLTYASLQARHFATDLGLEGSKLQTVLRFGGLEPTGRPSGKWRTFSPFEVLTIATLMRVKDATDLAIVRHPVLVEYLSDPSAFGDQSISIWSDGLSPALITDLKSCSQVIATDGEDHGLSALLRSDVTTILKLTPIVEFVFRAVRVGGNEEQMALIERLSSKRLHNLTKAVRPHGTEPIEKSSPQHQGPAIIVHRKPNLDD